MTKTSETNPILTDNLRESFANLTGVLTFKLIPVEGKSLALGSETISLGGIHFETADGTPFIMDFDRWQATIQQHSEGYELTIELDRFNLDFTLENATDKQHPIIPTHDCLKTSRLTDIYLDWDAAYDLNFTSLGLFYGNEDPLIVTPTQVSNLFVGN